MSFFCLSLFLYRFHFISCHFFFRPSSSSYFIFFYIVKFFDFIFPTFSIDTFFLCFRFIIYYYLARKNARARTRYGKNKISFDHQLKSTMRRHPTTEWPHDKEERASSLRRSESVLFVSTLAESFSYLSIVIAAKEKGRNTLAATHSITARRAP
eukprot:gene7344-5178_t